MVYKNEVMTTQELAEYIKMNEKTIIKMAQSGDLPGVKVGNKWRFRLSAIDDYLQGEVFRKQDDDLDLIIQTAENIIPISRLIEPSMMVLNLKSKTKEEVLYELSALAVDVKITSSVYVLFEELKKREKMLSTAICNGVAIPHARNPRIGLFNKSRIVFGRSINGINFMSPDKKRTHLFFMICPVNAFVHLRIVAQVAKLIHGKDTIQTLLEAENKEAITRGLLEFERTQMIFAEKKK